MKRAHPGCRPVAPLVAFALAVPACRPFPPMPAYERPDCPGHEINLTVHDSTDEGWLARQVTDIPIAPTIDEIPEFHDCQRLVNPDGAAYGPLVGIFAHEQLDTLLGRYGERGEVTAGPGAEGERGSAAAVAQIFSFDDEPYPSLGIRREFNCLYILPGQGGDASGWRAFMVWARSDADRCAKPLTTPSAVPPVELAVRVHKGAADADGMLVPQDIPPVARWDLDSLGRAQLIGIKCGAWWCTIGPAGKMASASRPRDELGVFAAIPGAGPHTAREENRVVMVKGWHDDQTLAVQATGGGVGLVPGGPRGTVYPHPALGRLNSPGDFEGAWVPAAYVMIDGEPGPYRTKLNLETGRNIIELRHGPKAEVVPDGAEVSPCSAEADGLWWARILHGGDSAKAAYRCVTFRAHPLGAKLPGTVRWRWDPDDEKTWIRCPNGCCTVE